MKAEFYIEYEGKKVAYQDILDLAKDIWKDDGNRKMKDLEQVQIYYKPQESKCYYVFRESAKNEEEGSFTI